MNKFTNVLQLSAVMLNACFIGGMLLIAIVLVPYWQALEPQVFLDWFSVYSDSIGNMMIPLGPIVVLLAIVSFYLNPKARFLWGLTILFLFANVAYFILYHKPTNAMFSEQTIVLDVVTEEVDKWLTYHWQRLFFACCGLVTSIMAVLKSMRD